MVKLDLNGPILLHLVVGFHLPCMSLHDQARLGRVDRAEHSVDLTLGPGPALLRPNRCNGLG